MDSFDLIIIGTGSGNSILTPDFDDWNVALVERDVFGGTCLNRGCIPSKMFIYPSDIVESVRTSSRLGVDASVDAVRWSDIVDRVFGRIDPIAAGGEEYRKSLDNVTVFNADARIVGAKQVDVGDRVITADTIVLAAGARPRILDIPGLDAVTFHTSDSIMRLPAPPERLLVLGGGFIACEMAHVFDAAGSKVTMINRSNQLLRNEDEEISARFTEVVADRFDLRCGVTVSQASQTDGVITLELSDGSSVDGDALLVATGRMPNGEQLGVANTGVEIDEAGYVVVDEHMRTGVDGIWAIGDICTKHQLKHTANAETRVVAHNIINPNDLRTVDYSGVPHAVFTSPQIGAVGATEQALREAGTPFIKATKDYAATAYGWAMEDDHSFVKLLADPETRTLLGAHIIGHQAASLVQLLIQGMQFGLTVDEMAKGQLWIHPALTEVVENALLDL